MPASALLVPALIRLLVQAPPECPGVEGVARRVNGLMGSVAVQADAARTASVVVTREAAGLVAEVQLDGGRRTLRGRDCDTLLDAVALTLAVALEPMDNAAPAPGASAPPPVKRVAARPARVAPTARRPVLEPPPMPPIAPISADAPVRSATDFVPPTAVPPAAVSAALPSPSAVAVPDPVVVAVQPAARPERALPQPIAARSSADDDPPVRAPTWPLHLRLSGLADVGTTPGGVTLGGNLSLEYPLGPWSVGLEARWLAASTTAVAGGRVGADALGGGVLLCRQVGDLGACLTGIAARQVASGEGFAVSRSTNLPFLSVGLRGRYDLHLSAWGWLGLFAEAAVPLSQSRLRVDDVVVWTSAPVTLLGGVGVGFAP